MPRTRDTFDLRCDLRTTECSYPATPRVFPFKCYILTKGLKTISQVWITTLIQHWDLQHGYASGFFRPFAQKDSGEQLA